MTQTKLTRQEFQVFDTTLKDTLKQMFKCKTDINYVGVRFIDERKEARIRNYYEKKQIDSRPLNKEEKSQLEYETKSRGVPSYKNGSLSALIGTNATYYADKLVAKGFFYTFNISAKRGEGNIKFWQVDFSFDAEKNIVEEYTARGLKAPQLYAEEELKELLEVDYIPTSFVFSRLKIRDCELEEKEGVSFEMQLYAHLIVEYGKTGNTDLLPLIKEVKGKI